MVGLSGDNVQFLTSSLNEDNYILQPLCRLAEPVYRRLGRFQSQFGQTGEDQNLSLPTFVPSPVVRRPVTLSNYDEFRKKMLLIWYLMPLELSRILEVDVRY
jgi:hypothetical protein